MRLYLPAFLLILRDSYCELTMLNQSKILSSDCVSVINSQECYIRGGRIAQPNSFAQNEVCDSFHVYFSRLIGPILPVLGC